MDYTKEEKQFDERNKDKGIPKFEEFLQAFETFSKLKRGEYKVEPLDYLIHFTTEDNVYEMDTYQGKEALLKSFIENRSYDEIYTMTEENNWSEIYIDAGIEKHVFLPKMLNEWEVYWDDTYSQLKKEIGKTEHMDEHKKKSWRQFQVYMECYDAHGDSIKLASEIDDVILYPIAVITMLEIFDADTCYEEYCEHEFENGDWESITLIENSDDSPIFFIKPYEL